MMPDKYMNDIKKILRAINLDSADVLDDVISWCDKSDRATSGIPSIVALDDLTKVEQSSFSLTEADESVSFAMAVTAMLLTDKYERREGKDPNYSAVCFAMIGLANMWFAVRGGEDSSVSVSSYKSMEEDFSGDEALI
jgi:hypothetical protein